MKLETLGDHLNMFTTAPHECAAALGAALDVLSNFAESGDPKLIDAAVHLGPFGTAQIGYQLVYLKGRTVPKMTSNPLDYYIFPPLIYEG